jgi:hypothetical protein
VLLLIWQAVRHRFSAHRKTRIPFLSGQSLPRVDTAIALRQSSTSTFTALLDLSFEKMETEKVVRSPNDSAKA